MCVNQSGPPLAKMNNRCHTQLQDSPMVCNMALRMKLCDPFQTMTTSSVLDVTPMQLDSSAQCSFPGVNKRLSIFCLARICVKVRNEISEVFDFLTKCIGISKGAPGTCAPLTQYLSFSCSFRQKFGQMMSLVSPPWELTPLPSSGKSWIRH